MPHLLPTREELESLPWAARQRARRRVARVVREHLQALDDVVAVEVAETAARADWGRAVRDDARVLLAALPPDPDAAAHRAALAEAIRTWRQQRRTTEDQ